MVDIDKGRTFMGTTGLITVLLAAITLENLTFSRALGLTSYSLSLKTPLDILKYGGVYTWMALFTSFTNVYALFLADYYELPAVVTPFIILFVVVLVYVLTYFTARRILKGKARTIQRMLPLASFNTALFGILYVTQSYFFDFDMSLASIVARTLLYALGSGIGYILALLLLLSTKKRLELSPIPKAFRGIPILLLFIGLVSLAIYGLLGYSLAS